eukprot:gb/GECH01009516.1/.p1 GENE.gb/GECH01009516.1/~~gb/GECH01009516.1/.p1  ORF type:complete len:728 (+),score=173.26 gb/GECH01009516.1/:1-2184(+)
MKMNHNSKKTKSSLFSVFTSFYFFQLFSLPSIILILFVILLIPFPIFTNAASLASSQDHPLVFHQDRVVCPVWPLPKECSQSLSGDHFYLDPDRFTFNLKGTPKELSSILKQEAKHVKIFSKDNVENTLDDDKKKIIKENIKIVDEALARYHKIIFHNKNNVDGFGDQVKKLEEISLELESSSGYSKTLTHNVDESYQLYISSDDKQSSLTAKTIWGLLRGLETFSQLVVYGQVSVGKENDDSELKNGHFIYNLPINIVDQPRFYWRGLMIDTARHFLPFPFILHILNSMSFHKLNVLHWHITDAQSFPLDTLSDTSFPDLAPKGAFDPQKTVYNSNEIKIIIQEAKKRGIRVVPEIDVPGHTYSWGIGYPDLIAQCPSYSDNLNNVALNYVHSSTSQAVKEVFHNVIDLFAQEDFIHSGGDEVVKGCLREDPSIQEYIAKQIGAQNYTKEQANDILSKLFAGFQDDVADILSAKNRQHIIWFSDDIVSNPYLTLSDKTVVNGWRSQDETAKALTRGYRSIQNYGFYLDHLDQTWEDFYRNNPLPPSISRNLTQEQREAMLGGEVSMWGEHVHQFNFDSRVWPRAAAAAERLWTSEERIGSVTDAVPRFRLQQCRMNTVARNLTSAALDPGYCASPSTADVFLYKMCSQGDTTCIEGSSSHGSNFLTWTINGWAFIASILWALIASTCGSIYFYKYRNSRSAYYRDFDHLPDDYFYYSSEPKTPSEL